MASRNMPVKIRKRRLSPQNLLVRGIGVDVAAVKVVHDDGDHGQNLAGTGGDGGAADRDDEHDQAEVAQDHEGGHGGRWPQPR